MENAPGLVPATPDFYDYPWQPLTSAELAEDHFVTVTWVDRKQLRCYALWLAENTVGMGLDPVTRESMIDPADLPEPSALVSVTVTDHGALELHWQVGSGVTTAVHPGWLRHVANDEFSPAATLPPTAEWTSGNFTEPPSVDGTNVLTDESVQFEWLNLLGSWGLARLRNVPARPDFLRELATVVGPIRGSNFGDVFGVRSIPNPKPQENSTANTGLNLGQHADLPTRETPPGFQFLHCIENEVPDGWSRMTDGRALVRELETNHPESYEALTTLHWVFVNRSPAADHRWTGPMIDHGAPGQPLTLRAFYPVRAFPAMAEADVARGYAAMRTFSEVAHHARLQIRYPFAPGDVVGFDNRRVLHGRDAFDPDVGLRWLQGCYIDHDDVYSRLRVLRRSHLTHPFGPPDNQPQALEFP